VQLSFLSVDYPGLWPGLLGLECKRLKDVTDETGTLVDVKMAFQGRFHANLDLRQVDYLGQVDLECKNEC
jgi:hypothetical protein